MHAANRIRSGRANSHELHWLILLFCCLSAQFLHLQSELDKMIEDKIYLVERANHARALSRKTAALAAGDSDAHTHTDIDRPADTYSPAPILDRDWRALKAELNNEIKKNLSAMHATLEEKLKSVERKSHLTTLEHSRSIGSSLQQYEEKSRDAENILRKAQELYAALQAQAGSGVTVGSAVAAGVTAPSTRTTAHRPASPTVYPRAQSMTIPPPTTTTAPTPGTQQPQSPPTAFTHPPPFAATLPYYHDPKDPHQPFLAHATAPQGAYVPGATLVDSRPNPIHQYPPADARSVTPTGAGLRLTSSEVRQAADSALSRALSPLRHRLSASPIGSDRTRPHSSIHHHTSTDDLYLGRSRSTMHPHPHPHPQPHSKPYALIPSHFPPPAAPISFFDTTRTRSLGQHNTTQHSAPTYDVI